jgi:SSS family solute:Na+ symporter
LASLSTPDLIILTVYLLLITGIGIYFGVKKRNTGYFTMAGGRLPYWAVGLSIFGTYLSSNTFIGVTGKAYGTNWNYFVFSLSLPVAAWIAVRYFVPFYRKQGFISAYEHMENRFGAWARIYMVAGYLLTQLARMGSIMFGVALVLQAFLGIDLATIIIVMGVLVTLYTLLGGIEAVIWTDVLQSIILSAGAVIILLAIIKDVPGGFTGIIQEGMAYHKFSLGSFSPRFSESTFWVVLLYGTFINLNNFGIDQSFIQRYHAARDAADAGRSVWLSAKLYIPVSLLFFFIGTGLWVYYQDKPGELKPVKDRIILELESSAGDGNPYEAGSPSHASREPSDETIGDRVLPEFMVTKLPQGLTGLLIAALFAAAMSSIDTSLNSSATIIWKDIYMRYVARDSGEKESMRVLKAGTILWGFLGTVTGLLLIGVKSILDAWWQLSGIFAGGMLGLFLLGLVSKRTRGHTALISVMIGVIVIAWMTLSPYLPAETGWIRNHLHANMIVVTGTLTIFLAGTVISGLKRLK